MWAGAQKEALHPGPKISLHGPDCKRFSLKSSFHKDTQICANKCLIDNGNSYSIEADFSSELPDVASS
jgi:hypothetical protein